MSALEQLRDPDTELSVAWTALQKAFGPTVPAWEVETIRIELERRGVPTTDALMSKLLAAQTAYVSRTWCVDHDVLFAFALACDGIGANSEALHHPTPEQLCWAVRELQVVCEELITNDHGFDPDTIDPAVAAVLLDEGMCVTPDELEFSKDVLEGMTPHSQATASKAYEAFSKLVHYPSETLRRTLEGELRNAVDVQVRRLVECKLYVDARSERRARQHALLDSFR